MSKPRYDWWPYVKGMIRRYPALQAEYALKHEPRITTVIANGHGSGVPKPTEATALRELTQTKQREYEAVTKALNAANQLPDGEERLRMVDLIFWRQSHTLEGVALDLHYSWRTVAQWHREFIRDVAKQYGLFD